MPSAGQIKCGGGQNFCWNSVAEKRSGHSSVLQNRSVWDRELNDRCRVKNKWLFSSPAQSLHAGLHFSLGLVTSEAPFEGRKHA